MDDSMEIPCTQVLDNFVPDDSPQSSPDKKKEIGFLKINNTSYPIFTGENRIGRDPDTCSIVLEGKAISKEHAVILALSSDNVFIWDLDTKNKTRLNKFILDPHVRYQIMDGDNLYLADIPAAFCKLSKQNVVDETIDSSKEECPVVPPEQSTSTEEVVTADTPNRKGSTRKRCSKSVIFVSEVEFNSEAEYKAKRAKYSLKLEEQLGEMRKEEQQLRNNLIQQQLESARKEEKFRKEKRELELNILRKKCENI